MSEKAVFNTIHIKIPEKMHTITPKNNPGTRNALTKSKNFSKVNSKQSIKVSTDNTITKVVITDPGKTFTKSELKGYIINPSSYVNQPNADKKALWNSIKIKVPADMYTKKKAVGVRKTLTKANNWSKSDKKNPQLM